MKGLFDMIVAAFAGRAVLAPASCRVTIGSMAPYHAWRLALTFCLLSGCLIKPGEPDCPDVTECDRCLERSGCGFCDPTGEVGRCMPGTSYGPNQSEICPDSAWRFTACDEPPSVLRCGQLRSCSECVAGEGCGFCAEGSDCRALDHALECELETDARSQACLDADCRNVTDCEECAQREECGYCLNEMLCRYLGSESECVLVIDPSSIDCAAARCQQQASCDECAQAEEGCGWCLEEADCRHREHPEGCDLVVNPSSTTCDEAACLPATSCGECNALGYPCAWCDLWDFCSADSLSCPSEYRISADCPPENGCAAYESCSACLEDTHCAYCVDDIYWNGIEYDGCLVVDAVGEPYGDGTCYDLRETSADCPPPP